jgi:hypothetical protein
MMMKSLQLLSEAGESLDYLRDEVRHLGLYVTELETLVEAYYTFVVNVKLLNIPEIARRTTLLRETENVLGPKGSSFLHHAEDGPADEADPERTPMAHRRATRLSSATPP